MVKNSVLLNYTSWAYDITNRCMTALRGHKYHILPTNSSPLVISIALLLFLLTLVFNLHGSKIIFSGFDKTIHFFVNLFHREIFGKKIDLGYFQDIFTKTNKIIPEFGNYEHIHLFWLAPFFLTLGIFFLWSSNAIAEGTTSKIAPSVFFFGTNTIAEKIIVEPLYHTNLVRKGFKIGFILFIISEVMFFFGFFWGFFHSSISPTIQIGAVWPPVDIEFITVKGFAIANTVILLTSGATLTIAHYAFELIPQKRNRLYKLNTAFAESSASFEGKLNKTYEELNKNFFNSSRPEIYTLPFAKKILAASAEKVDSSTYSFAFPINLLLNPFTKHFSRNLGLRDTEELIRLYINLMLDATLILALLFMAFQGTEYFISPVNINTGIYGSTFYMITGLHGAHVFIGTCFLFYCRTAVGPS